jgi:hypothetical protein
MKEMRKYGTTIGYMLIAIITMMIASLFNSSTFNTKVIILISAQILMPTKFNEKFILNEICKNYLSD